MKGVYSFLKPNGQPHTFAYQSHGGAYQSVSLDDLGISLPPFPYSIQKAIDDEELRPYGALAQRNRILNKQNQQPSFYQSLPITYGTIYNNQDQETNLNIRHYGTVGISEDDDSKMEYTKPDQVEEEIDPLQLVPFGALAQRNKLKAQAKFVPYSYFSTPYFNVRTVGTVGTSGTADAPVMEYSSAQQYDQPLKTEENLRPFGTVGKSEEEGSEQAPKFTPYATSSYFSTPHFKIGAYGLPSFAPKFEQVENQPQRTEYNLRPFGTFGINEDEDENQAQFEVVPYSQTEEVESPVELSRPFGQPAQVADVPQPYGALAQRNQLKTVQAVPNFYYNIFGTPANSYHPYVQG